MAIAAVRGELTSNGMQRALENIRDALSDLVKHYHYTHSLGRDPAYVADLFDSMADLIEKEEGKNNAHG